MSACQASFDSAPTLVDEAGFGPAKYAAQNSPMNNFVAGGGIAFRRSARQPILKQQNKGPHAAEASSAAFVRSNPFLGKLLHSIKAKAKKPFILTGCSLKATKQFVARPGP